MRHEERNLMATRRKAVNTFPDFSSDDPGKTIPVYLEGSLFRATYRGTVFSDVSYSGLIEQITAEMTIIASLRWIPILKLIIRPWRFGASDSTHLFPSVECERCHVSDRPVCGALYTCDWQRPYNDDEQKPWPRFLGSHVMDVPHATIPLELPCRDQYHGPMGDWQGLYLAYTEERWRAVNRWSWRLSAWSAGDLLDALLSPAADAFLMQQQAMRIPPAQALSPQAWDMLRVLLTATAPSSSPLSIPVVGHTLAMRELVENGLVEEVPDLKGQYRFVVRVGNMGGVPLHRPTASREQAE
jgi:hypothetical protein